MFSNYLTEAEIERLALLSEEMAESQQVIGKILRHGYRSFNPEIPDSPINRASLERELGDVRYAISLMTLNGDVNEYYIKERARDKAATIHKYLHHQQP